ncbi:hypothetical protein [Saccharopolyspora rosea]|uniref:hypothetical protein n=1 Tax=Saccharopolyspora rosea TaxID=524884 RepID=UPI0021D8809D|nr:hypothetical protein [Saccharopolyspora rosea]
MTAAVIGVVLLAAGCQSPGPTPTSPQQTDHETPPGAAPAPSPADVAKSQAIEAYRNMWAAMARAGETSDWRSLELARYATDNALTTITRSLYTDHFNHVVTRGWPRNAPTVTSAEPASDPSTVMLSDCGDSTRWLKYQEGTSTLVDDKPGGRQSIVAEVKRQADGAWRVTQFAVQGVGSC